MTRMASDMAPFTISRNMPFSKDRLWQLLTDLEHMKQWYFQEIPYFSPRKGFKTQFSLVNGDKRFTHQWEVVEVQAKEWISYDWTFTEYAGKSRSTFKLGPADDNRTQLAIIVDVLESFPSGINEFTKESCAGGWNWFLDRLAQC